MEIHEQLRVNGDSEEAVVCKAYRDIISEVIALLKSDECLARFSRYTQFKENTEGREPDLMVHFYSPLFHLDLYEYYGSYYLQYAINTMRGCQTDDYFNAALVRIVYKNTSAERTLVDIERNVCVTDQRAKLYEYARDNRLKDIPETIIKQSKKELTDDDDLPFFTQRQKGA